jgi:hypothetical protein
MIGRLTPAPTFKENGAWNRQYLTPLLLAAEGAGTDRFLEHAIIFAALPFRDFSMLNATLGAEPEGGVMQRIGLYCLSQTEPDEADKERVVALLASADAGVREAAVFGVEKVPAWRDAAGVWLKEQIAGDGDPTLLRAAVQAVAGEGTFRADLGAWLGSAKSAPMQKMLLEVMAEIAAAREFPREWGGPLAVILEKSESGTAALAAAVFSMKPPKLTDELRGKLLLIARDSQRHAAVRLPLMLALGTKVPSDEEFSLLMAALNPETPPDSPVASLASTAAAVLAKASLTSEQLSIVAEILPKIALLHRPQLLRAFSKATDEALGLLLVAQLEKSGALNNLSAQDQAECLGKFPAKVQERLSTARQKLNLDVDQRRARLDELEKNLPSGDALRGKVVFQSAKASCVLCHQAGYFG